MASRRNLLPIISLNGIMSGLNPRGLVGQVNTPLLGTFPSVPFAQLEYENTLANYPNNYYRYSGDQEVRYGQNAGGIAYFFPPFITDMRYMVPPEPDFTPTPERVFGPWTVSDDTPATVDDKFNLVSLANTSDTSASAIFATAIDGYYGGDYVLEWTPGTCPDVSIGLLTVNGITLTEDDQGTVNGLRRKVYTLDIPPGLVAEDMGGLLWTVIFSAPVTGYIDWHFYMPGHEEASKAGYPFSKTRIDQLSTLTTWRCMDILNTNHNPSTTPDTITDDSWATWGELGMPHKYTFRVCAAAGIKSLWINMTHAMTDETLDVVAARCRAEYDATAEADRITELLVEFSNEIWNAGFTQTNYAVEQGGILFPERPGYFEQMGGFYAARSRYMKNAFLAAFAGTPLEIKMVMGGFQAIPETNIERVASPSVPGIENEVDVFVVGAYFGNNVDQEFADAENIQNWTDDQFLNYCLRQGDEAQVWENPQNPGLDVPGVVFQFGRRMDEVDTATGRTDIQRGTYEHGQHFDTFIWQESPNREAQRDRLRSWNASVQMGVAYLYLHQGLLDAGADYLVGFGGFGGLGESQFWGNQRDEWGLPYDKKLSYEALVLPRVQELNTVNFHVFGHSLWQYSGGDAAPTDAYTNGGNWLGRLASTSGKGYGGTYNFGQYSQHNALDWTSSFNVGGFNDLGNTLNPSPDNQFQGNAYTHVMTMPSNFLESDMGQRPFSGGVTTSGDEFIELYDNVKGAYPSCEMILYVHWQDAGALYAGAENMDRATFTTYNNDLINDYMDWHKRKQDYILSTNREIRTFPVGPVIAFCLENMPELRTIQFNQLYGDSAPHGSRTIYFLVALVVYRCLYKVNPDISSFTTPAGFGIRPEVENNLQGVIDMIEARLEYINATGVRVYGVS